MMKTKVLFTLFFLSFLHFVLFAQEQPSVSPPPPQDKKEADYDTLVEKTLPLDIETASYYELVSWCRMLRLDESGDKAALVLRLKNHFKVKEAGKEQKEIIRKIEIKSARSSEYFTLDELKEDYVLMQGNVAIVLVENKGNTQHTIKAERILYNQSKSMISASGNIEYTRQKGDKAEIFRGETFVFDVSNWEGVLYFAQGEREKTVEDQQVIFRYRGETVTRLKDNSVLLENGTITSSPDVLNPNYKITARRIWVFAPGEWAIENAVLYLGHLPVLYIPFYYYSSDELFFNPVIGFKPREGAYFQSTIYFIGKKEREEGMLSFLQLEEASDQDYEMKLDGLFLRPVRKEGTAAPAATQTMSGAIKHLKMFVDLYSRLGGFAGVSLDITPAFKIYSGIGVSRSIFLGQFGSTPFYSGTDYWNSGYFFNLKTPFRFGLETEFDLAWGILQKISGRFHFFSDPFFAQDFYSREEGQDWGKVFGFELASQTATPPTVSTSQRTNLVWTLNLQLNFTTLVNSPLFQTLRIDPFNFTFEWGSKYLNISDPIVAADPARMFYYPQRLIFPNFALGIGGRIFQYTASNEVAAEKTQAQKRQGGDDLRLPLDAEKKTEGTPLPDKDQADIRKPDVKQDVAVSRTTKYFSTTLSYSLNHLFKAEHLFNQEKWLSVEDITYETKYTTFDHTGTSTVNYQLSFWNSLVEIIGNFSLLEKYKVTYNPFLGFDQTITDKQYTSFDLSETISCAYAPFIAFQDFKDTRIAYNLKWDFFDIYYNPTANSYFERLIMFSRDTVSQQQITANLIYQPEDKQHWMKMIYTIPPVLGRFYSELNFYLWMFQTTVVAEYKEQTNAQWYFEPLRITEKALFEHYASFSSTFRYNLENNTAIDLEGIGELFLYRYRDRDRYLVSQEIKYDFLVDTFSKSLTTIDLWDLKTTLLAQRMYPLSPLGKQGSEQQFLFYKLGFSYYLNLSELYFWQNRIALLAGVTTSLNLDFQKHVDSNFALNFQFTLKIHKFLDIGLKIDVYNNNVYRYIPAFVDAVNADLSSSGIPATITPISPFEDFWKSINFFNLEDRYDSFFKLRSLGIDFVHYLEDWVFRVSFTGVFKFQTRTDGNQIYEWIPTVSFSLKWLAIPEVKREITGDETGMQF